MIKLSYCFQIFVICLLNFDFYQAEFFDVYMVILSVFSFVASGFCVLVWKELTPWL